MYLYLQLTNRQFYLGPKDDIDPERVYDALSYLRKKAASRHKKEMAYYEKVGEMLEKLLPEEDRRRLQKILPATEPIRARAPPDVRLEDIANLQEAKRAIEESIIYPSRRPDLFPLGWARGILFYGPPGCGKTMLAAAIANEIDATFYYIDSRSIVSKRLVKSEKNVAKIFQDARTAAKEGWPVIIFIDELDSMMGISSREVGGEVRARNQFLKEMDGITEKKNHSSVYVIGATDKPWALDEPFIRRFQKRIYVPLPDADARLEMFHICSRKLRAAKDVDFVKLAGLTEGRTGSDIRDIFQAVQMKVVREFFRTHADTDPTAKPREISMADFMEAVSSRGRTVSERNLARFKKWSQDSM